MKNSHLLTEQAYLSANPMHVDANIVPTIICQRGSLVEGTLQEFEGPSTSGEAVQTTRFVQGPSTSSGAVHTTRFVQDDSGDRSLWDEQDCDSRGGDGHVPWRYQAEIAGASERLNPVQAVIAGASEGVQASAGASEAPSVEAEIADADPQRPASRKRPSQQSLKAKEY